MQSRSQFREICRSRSRRGGERLKNRKKVQKYGAGHKCPNYLAGGIRSTAIIWTGHTEISAVVEICGTDARTERASERLATPFRRLRCTSPLTTPPVPSPAPSAPRCPNSHSDAPNYPLLSPAKARAPFCHPVRPGKPIPLTSVFPERTVDARDSPPC